MNLRISFLLVILSIHSLMGFCEIRLPRLISDGAVMQRDTELKLWGWAAPDEVIALHFNEQTYSAKADELGNWWINLPPQPAGGPYEMVFEGSNKITLRNLLFGEVWLCSGQSNMELTMQRLQDQYPDIIKNSANPQIRQFLVPDKYDFHGPNDDLESGTWKEANPDQIFEFSGVAYFYALELYHRYQVPVGLINAAMGGSPVEAWMSEDALRKFPDAFAELQRFKNPSLIQEIEQEDNARRDRWYEDIADKDQGLNKGAEWFTAHLDDADWKEMEVPNAWADQDLGYMNGVVWFRKTVNVSNNMAGKEASLWLGRIVDQDSVYVNGVFVGTTGYQYPPRKYTIPAGILTSGENTITVRIINQAGRGGFIHDKPYFLAVAQDSIDLRGMWKYKPGVKMGPLQGPTFVRWKPGGLYNKMIAPLTNYQIRGVIWYQGESNTNDPKTYASSFPDLIQDWRNAWQIGDFPFLFVQLANFMEETPEPTESAWAELRQAQLGTLSLPNTGMAVSIDLGVWNDIHPLNKKDVGKRLAQLAFAMAYGEANTAFSPIPQSHKFLKSKVKITFANDGDALMAKNKEPLSYFEISADGKTFVKAQASIQGNQVTVWNDQISQPVAVRYAWANNPLQANLYSSNGLPASPFEIRK
ncbi:MAG: beta galactosidase jelly roll domain-containing protein [Bacteroidia bacterium]|nr:beta galactosidase jelly roll domain-containing protein [Bacteroidia bacterium]